jgi:hypothetical protein
MDRRELLGALGVGTVGLLAVGGNADAQEQARFQYHSQLDKTHVDCLDACTACAAVCNEASHHCLTQIQKGSTDKDHHARAHHLAMDCAAVCAVSAALVARQSPLMDAQCNACADACRRCAEECEKGQSDAGIMKDCVRICRECERSCREMVRAMGGRSGGGR